MPQPVKLSDPIIEQARAAAAGADRSMAAQIEHWARLGRAVEAVLTAPHAAALKRGEGPPVAADESERAALLRALRLAVVSAGHVDLGRVLRAAERDRYGTDPALPDCIVRHEPDGTRTPGHIVQRRFVPLTAATSAVTRRRRQGRPARRGA